MKDKILSIAAGLITTILVITTLSVPSALADGYKQQKAHIHGVAHLNLALESNVLLIEFTSPAADIVGFEHEPKTEEEKSAMQKALGKLRLGERMFKSSPGAGVSLEKAIIKTGLTHECDHEGHDHGADSHEQHSDVSIEYRFEIKTPDKLKSIDVMLFKYFKSLEKIKVQVLTPTRQTAAKLTPENTKIYF